MKFLLPLSVSLVVVGLAACGGGAGSSASGVGGASSSSEKTGATGGPSSTSATGAGGASVSSSASAGGASSSSTGVGGQLQGWTAIPFGPSLPFDWSSGAIAAHPTDPSELAVLHSPNGPSPFGAAVSISISHDGGVSAVAHPASLQLPDNCFGTARGFAFNPNGAGEIAGLVALTGVPIADAVQLLDLGGMGLSTFPPFDAPDRLKFVGGSTPELAVRNRYLVAMTKGLGPAQIFETSYEYPSDCIGADFSVDPDDHAHYVLACDDGIARCQGQTCARASLPFAFKADAVELDPNHPQRVFATGLDAQGKVVVLRSDDGAASFTKLAELGTSPHQKLVLDRRSGAASVYVGEGAKLYRSIDGGSSWSDATPPADLVPNQGTVLIDFDVAADGSVVALASAGTLRLPAP